MRDVKVGRASGHNGLGDWLKGPECRRMVGAKASEAQTIYQAIVRKKTGRLARSAKATTVIGGVKGDRWVGRVTVGESYAAAHEFGHDQNGTRRDGFHELRETLKRLGG